MNLLTIIVLIIFALYMLKGYRRGFIRGLASMASLVVSLILVSFATPYVTGFLESQTPLYDYVTEKCRETFQADAQDEKENQEESEKENLGESTGSQLAEAVSKTAQDQIIDNLPIPVVLKNMLKENNTQTAYKELAVNSFNEYVPRFMANLIMNIISFVVTWILVISFISLAVMTLDVIANLPVIHGMNQLLGLGLGFIQALLTVWIGFLVITVFAQTDAGKQLMVMISESPLLEAIYDSNILLEFLQNTIRNFF